MKHSTKLSYGRTSNFILYFCKNVWSFQRLPFDHPSMVAILYFGATNSYLGSEHRTAHGAGHSFTKKSKWDLMRMQ